MFKKALWIFLGVGVGIYKGISQERVASPQEIEKAYIQALQKYREGEYEESLEIIRTVIKGNLDNFRLRYLAAHDHWKKKRYIPAGIHFSNAIKIDPSYEGGYIDYALMLYEEGKYEKAKDLLDRAKKRLSSFSSKFYLVYARLLLRLKKLEEARRHILLAKENAKWVKDKVEALFLEARYFWMKKDYKKARFSLEWAGELQEENPYILYMLGYLWEKEGKKEKAEELYKRALSFELPSSLERKIENRLQAL